MSVIRDGFKLAVAFLLFLLSIFCPQICSPLPALKEIQDRVKNCLKVFREDHLRGLNPTPYKVSFTILLQSGKIGCDLRDFIAS